MSSSWNQSDDDQKQQQPPSTPTRLPPPPSFSSNVSPSAYDHRVTLPPPPKLDLPPRRNASFNSSGGSKSQLSSSGTRVTALPPPPVLNLKTSIPGTSSGDSGTVPLISSGKDPHTVPSLRSASIVGGLPPPPLPRPPIPAPPVSASTTSATITPPQSNQGPSESLRSSPVSMDSQHSTAAPTVAPSVVPKIDLTNYHPLLATRHSALPILVIATVTATEAFAQANSFHSLCDLFQYISDSLGSSSATLGTAGAGAMAVAPIPFRSISRTIQLEVNADRYGGLEGRRTSTAAPSSMHLYDPRASVTVRFLDRELMDRELVSQGDAAVSTTSGAEWNKEEYAEKELNAAAATIASDCSTSNPPFPHGNDMSMMELTELIQQLHISTLKKRVQQKRIQAGMLDPTTVDGNNESKRSVEDSWHGVDAGSDADFSTSSTDNADNRNIPAMDVSLLTKLTASTNLPFMKHLRLVLDSITDFTTHEMIHCPLVHLLIATTSDPDYLLCLRELATRHHLPRAYNVGQFDPSDVSVGHGGAKRYFVLLHDASAKDVEFDDVAAMKSLQSTFPHMECVILTLNNATSSTSVGTAAQPQHPEQRLSLEDLQKLRSFVSSIIRDGCIPTMERRIFYLNAVVSNAKKGVKNVFKSFWRKPKNSDTAVGAVSSLLGGSLHGGSNHGGGEASSNSVHDKASSHGGVGQGVIVVPYKYDTVESQARLLADSLFLMRDYELALGFYRLVKDDFKADKAMVYYAAIQEMIALCLYIMDNGGKGKYGREIHHAIENALYSYTRAADEEALYRSSTTSSQPQSSRPQTAVIATRLATRLCLVVSGATMSTLPPSRLLEIADLLASASSHETPLGAAILLEQASGHYLAASHYKKYAFHMLMSGHMYRSCHQERHAARCFTAALYLYQRTEWKELLDHLQSALAQQLYSCEYFSLALLLYIQLMDGSTVGKISSKSLHKFWNHILDICKSKPGEAEVGARLLREVMSDSSRRTSVMEVEIAGSTSCDFDSPREIVLELCNLDLPRVLDSTLEVIDVASVLGRNSDENDILQVDNNGRASVQGHTETLLGSEDVWTEMSNFMDAELRVFNVAGGGVVTTDAVLSSLRQVETDRAFERRTQNAEKPKTKACGEPILVNVVLANPLTTQLHLTDIQLVAELKGARAVGSNERAGESGVRGSISKTWTFECCPNKVFKTPSFYCETCVSDVSIAENDWSPYFCVEEKGIAMDASSVLKATLAICPLVEGEFSILGLRCKLFDHVWMYHPFFIQGPLLQDTRQHKANRIRAPRQLLKSIITRDMPLLKIDMEIDVEDFDAGCSMMQGEVSAGTFRIRNVGNAPAHRVFLKTNVPWICCVGEVESHPNQTTLEKMSTSHCVGPSGTLLKLPIKEVLEPGDSADVAFRLKANGGGKQELYLLFSYEGVDHHATSTFHNPNRKSAVRTVKMFVDVSVYPSLTLTASVIPTFWDARENVLSVELTNYRSDRQDKLDIALTRVCIGSRFYKAIKLDGRLPKSSPLRVSWQERITLHYLLAPSMQGDRTCIMSECETIESNNDYGMSDFACLEHAHDAFKTNVIAYRKEQARLAQQNENEHAPRDIAHIRRDKTKINRVDSMPVLRDDTNGNGPEDVTCHLTSDLSSAADDYETDSLPQYEGTSLSALCSSDDPTINFICKWSGISCNTEKNVSGLHHILQLPVLPTRRGVGCPLTITSKYKANIYHEFSLGPVNVPFEVTVCNILAPQCPEMESDREVEFEFAVMHQHHFELIGADSFRWKLKGGEDITITLNAVFSVGGVYNLQCIRLTIVEDHPDNLEKVPYLFPMQWIVHLHDMRDKVS